MHARITATQLPLLTLTSLVALSACGHDGSGSGAAFAGEIEFRAEQPLLPGIDLDSGWLPEGLPVAVRATMTASGGVTVVARATTDGEMLTPVPGSGSLAIDGGLAIEVSARIDAAGLSIEDVVQSFDYGIAAEQTTFDPFALDAPVSMTSALPAADLGSVPIPGAPGATLAFSVTGGTLVTTFAGSCAEARDGLGQYAGALTMGGSLIAAATVEIDIAFVLTESFGPFEIELPIPPVVTAMDLGTRSLATGEAVASMGLCEASEPTGGDDPAPTADDGVAETGDGGPGTSGSADDSTTASADDEDTSGDDTTTGAPDGDPDYPSPFDGECPAGSIAVGLDVGTENGVCLPECGLGEACPSGASGSATGVCAFNPGSSYEACVETIDCAGTGVDGETCNGGACSLPPSHCVLGCDEFQVCPDSMTCESGVCLYVV